MVMAMRIVATIGSLVMTMLAPGMVEAYEVNAKAGTVTLSSVQDFERCQRDGGASDWCLNGLTAYVKAHPNTAFAAGKSVRARFNHWVALSFFATALDKLAPAQCADDDLQLAVISGLALPADEPSHDLALKIARGQCWSALQAPVQRALPDGSELYRTSACALFKDKSVAAPECLPQAAPQPAAVAPASARLIGLRIESLATDVASARSFRGIDNEQVLWIRAKAPHADVVLLKFKGIRGPWNNAVVPCIERPETGATTCLARVDGAERTVLITEDGSYQAWPQGYPDGLRVFRERLSDHPKAASSADVVKEFSFAPSGGAKP